MEIQINDETFSVHEHTSIHDVIFSILKLSPIGIAIAVNDAIVPKSEWERSFLHPFDKILVIRPSSGG